MDSPQVICPSPREADNFREKTKDLGLFGAESVVTISKFTTDQLIASEGKDKIKSLKKNKADLILELGPLWKQYFPTDNYNQFIQAFNLLTELRSFTLDFSQILEIFEEVPEGFDENIIKAMKIFWNHLHKNQIIDEHQQYFKLKNEFANNYKRGNLGNTLIFWGFRHLSSVQVDFIKEMANTIQVIIPIPLEVFISSKMTDWVRWLDTSLEEKNKDETSQKININSKLITYQKGKMAEVFRDVYSTLPLEKTPEIFLAKGSPDFLDFNQISINRFMFKTSVDIFQSLNESFLKEFSKWKTFEEVKNGIDGLLISEKEKDFNQKNFRKLKLIDLYLLALEIYKESFDGKNQFTQFDLAILCNHVLLNLPRVSVIPLIDNVDFNHTKGLDELFTFDSEKLNILCADSLFGPLKGQIKNYNPEVLLKLMNIGPIKGPDLEFNFIKFYIKDLLTNSASILLLEDGIGAESAEWQQILNDLEFNSTENYLGTAKVKAGDVLNTRLLKTKGEIKIKSISATRLQSFIDCKRKYYYSYIESIFPQLRPIKEVTFADRGTLSEEVVRAYLEKQKTFLEKEHRLLCSEILKKYCTDNLISPDFLEYENTLIEIIEFSKKGILFLLSFKELNGTLELEFKKNFQVNSFDGKTQFKGEIDCLIKVGELRGILDIKRSKSSIPSKTDLFSFNKVQLPFYLCHGPLKPNEIDFFGWISLAESEESMIICKNDEIKNSFNNKCHLGPKVFHSLEKENISIENWISSFTDFENEKVIQMDNEQEFLANPLSLGVCHYCVLSNVCTKGINFNE